MNSCAAGGAHDLSYASGDGVGTHSRLKIMAMHIGPVRQPPCAAKSHGGRYRHTEASKKTI